MIILICLPYLVTFVIQGDFLNERAREGAPDGSDGSLSEGTAQLIAILANEMPVTYEKEALKAQAVIARTNLAYADENDQPEPTGLSKEDMRDLLGAQNFQKKYELLKSCADETADEVVTYKGSVVQLPYHFVSAGSTRNLSEIGQDKSMPYLKAVPSVYDLRCENYLKIEFLSKKQFLNKLKAAYPKLDFPEKDVEKMAQIKERDSSSYVLTVELPGQKISGEDFKNIFLLNSTCFSVKEVDGQVRLITKGYGQGYGMSQYGANEMAKEGMNYKEILSYYYDGIQIGGE